MEPAGDLVSLAAELASGVQHREDDLDGRLLHLRVLVHRHTPAVVGDTDGVVGVNHHVDGRAVAGEGLVDGVVDDLVDQVMESFGSGGPDVHTGPLANSLKSLENLNVLG